MLLFEKGTLKDTSIDFGVFDTLKDAKSLILTPKRYNDHTQPLPTGVPPFLHPGMLPLFVELGPKIRGDSQKVVGWEQ